MLLTLDVLIIIIIIGCCAMLGFESRCRKYKGTRGELTLKPKARNATSVDNNYV